jgi:Zn-dependent protease with chaperone function
MVEVSEKEQPDLFAFLRQLCADTGAPMPHRVYCSHEVNACVFYSTSLFSLFFPTRKNLLIGLGLLQTLNLTELKALLAHELGHFAQSSMRVGSYVYMANKVLSDIVYGRDFLDRFLLEMKSWDERLAVFAEVFSVILGYLRLALEAIFKGINLLNLSLLRQMEFNADRFAVKMAGSDAVGQVLNRCQYADEVWAKLQADLWAASDHHLYSDNIFAHFETASAAVAHSKKNTNWGARAEVRGPDAFLFTKEKDHAKVPDMWATHPSNYDRERQAKATYFPAETDERSAWLLLRDSAGLRRAVSKSYYAAVHQPTRAIELVDAARVQQFLNEEYAETTYGEHYAGYYDDRYLEIKDLHCLPTRASITSGQEALAEIEAIHASFAEWTIAHRRRQEEVEHLATLQGGAELCAEFEFRGQRRSQSELTSLLVEVQRELAQDDKALADGDARLYLAHQLLAREVNSAQEFDERYQFHLQVQDMHQKITDALGITHEVLDFLDGCNGAVSSDAFSNVVAGFREAVSRLNEVSMASTRVRVPLLKNMQDGRFLNEFLELGDLMDEFRYRSDSIESAWINRLLNQLSAVEDKLQRLLGKSLGGILVLQEHIVEQWRQQPTVHVEQPAKRPWH